MNNTFEVNIELLIEPCENGSPVGIDWRCNADPHNPYRLMKEARHTARQAERHYLDGQDVDQSDVYWQAVAEYGVGILQNSSKDIDVLAWLTEAWLRLYGFAGLSYGFKLTLHCFERYGLTLHPTLSEQESLEWKVKALTGLNGEDVEGSLIMPIRLLGLTKPSAYTLWQYHQAVDIDNIQDPILREKRLQQGAVSLEDFMRELYAIPRDDLLSVQQYLEQAQQYFDKLTDLLQDLLQDAAPPSSHIANALDEYHEGLMHLVQLHQQAEPSQAPCGVIHIVDNVSFTKKRRQQVMCAITRV